MITAADATAKINTAADPHDLFGDSDAQARAVFRAYARVLHPDAVGGSDHAAAFQRLNDLYEWWRTGDEPRGASRRIIITTRKRTYLLGDQAARGDVANVYYATYDNAGTPADVLVKMPRTTNDNDLMEAERAALNTLAGVDKKWHPFYPALIESFRHQDRTSRARRRVNVFAEPPSTGDTGDGYLTLEDLLTVGRYDGRDIAWIWRRLLVALGVAHDAGLVHGAPTPDNVLIHPISHAVILLDWCYSVEADQPLRARPTRWERFYPRDEVTDKQPVTSALDLYVAHAMLAELLEPNAPREFRAILAAMTSPRPQARPNALDALDAVDTMLTKLYGPRRYRPLIVPTPA